MSILLALSFAACALVSRAANINLTPLDEYVRKVDGAFGWTELPGTISGTNAYKNRTWVGYTLNVTSQFWLKDSDFSPSSNAKSLWWHYLVVIVPDEVHWERNGTIWITGGSVTDGPPQPNSEDIICAAALAMGTNVITGAFFQVPNEHYVFASDPIQKSRTEDAIVAFTWDHFLRNTSDSEWLIYFPMVKAGVKAMDAMTEFVSKKFDHKYTLDYYTVAGASKRGWTTWLVGAVDSERVVAISPIVLDAINFVAVEHHQWRSYGGWTFALQDYIDMDIMTRLDTPEMALLQAYIDPFFYRERLTMPKLVVNAILDEFQQPDDTHYWWNQMPEPKHFIMTPNAEHSMMTGILEAVPAIGTWIHYLLEKAPVPTFTWKISPQTGAIDVTLDSLGEVFEASVYSSNSCGNNGNVKRRDFRVANADADCACGIFNIQYEGYCANLKSLSHREILNVTVSADGTRSYSARVRAPIDGRYVAYFIDIKYAEKEWSSSDGLAVSAPGKLIPLDKPGRLEFTTEVSVWPNTFPYEDCNGSSCSGSIV